MSKKNNIGMYQILQAQFVKGKCGLVDIVEVSKKCISLWNQKAEQQEESSPNDL